MATRPGQRICVMNKGRVAQIGAPLLDVYRQPADAFVARFLGSPPMNLLPATVVEHQGSRAARLGLSLARWSGTALPEQAGGVLLGVRPEALHLADANDGDALRGSVVGIEPLGAETLLMVALEGEAGELTARLHRDTRSALGDAVRLRADPAALYLFDARTERAIVPPVLALAA